MDPFTSTVKRPHTVLTIDPQFTFTKKLSTQKQNKKALSNIIMIFFNFAYHHGLSPFMIRDFGKQPVISTWWLPKMMWAMNLVPCLLFRTAESRLILNDFSSDWNPAEYFRVVHAFVKVIFHMTMWQYMWCKSEAFLKVVGFMYNSETLPIPSSKMIVKLLPPFLAALFVVFGVFLGTNSLVAFMNCFYSEESVGSYKKIFFMWLERGKYAMFLTHEGLNCEQINVNRTLSLVEILVGIGSGIGILFRQMSGFYEELLLPTGICVFWLSSREFAKRISTLSAIDNKELSQTLWEHAMGWYSSLKEFSVLVKNAYGEILFYRLILLIFDVPITFGLLDNLADQARFLIMFTVSSGVFIVAADAHKQIQTFESWISKVVDQDLPWISHQRLSMLIHQLQSNSVGISLSVGFTITYSFIANASGILITYFIICVQYRNSSSSKCQ